MACFIPPHTLASFTYMDTINSLFKANSEVIFASGVQIITEWTTTSICQGAQNVLYAGLTYSPFSVYFGNPPPVLFWPQKSQRQINTLAGPFLLMEIIFSCVLFKPLLTPKTHFALVEKSQGQIDTLLAHLLSDLAELASAIGNQCLLVLFKPGQASAAGSTKKPELFSQHFLQTPKRPLAR